VSNDVVVAALSEMFAQGRSVRDAVNDVVQDLGVAHRETYALALRLRADEAL
jgi:hypothetical protein